MTVQVPSDLFGSRVWGRTACKGSGNSFRCETGDCGPWEKCAGDGTQRGGRTPATLAEFTLGGDGGKDFYDVSLVDGFNIQMSIFAKTKQPGGSGPYWCTDPKCLTDINLSCPEDLKTKNAQGTFYINSFNSLIFLFEIIHFICYR